MIAPVGWIAQSFSALTIVLVVEKAIVWQMAEIPAPNRTQIIGQDFQNDL